MAILTNVTIKDYVKRKRIAIVPFNEEKGLTPVGYDVFASDVVMIRENGRARLVEPRNNIVMVPPGAQFLALTLEQVALAPRMAATIHSQVKLVSLGMSHISTTIDPGWNGRLLLAMVNLSGADLPVDLKEPIATIVFHTTTAPAKRKHKRPKRNVGAVEDDLLNRETGKLRTLGEDILQAALPKLKDAPDTAARRDIAQFIVEEAPRAEFIRRVLAVLVSIGLVLIICFPAWFWAKVVLIFPGITPENFFAAVGAISIVIGLVYWLWKRRD